MITLERYDSSVARVCARTAFSDKDRCRAVPGARWEKSWKSPLQPGMAPVGVWHWPVTALPVLLRRFPQVETRDALVTKALDRARAIHAARDLTRKVSMSTMAEGVVSMLADHGANVTLFKHQQHAVERTLQAGGTRALFHQTGTGKTITAATLLSALVAPVDGLRVGVVVCPVTLVRTAWIPDLQKRFPRLPIVNLRDSKKGEDREYQVKVALSRYGMCIALVNYETVRTDPSVRRIMSGAAVVLDESSKVKNDHAAVTQEILRIAPTFRSLILLSGTPAPNTPEEYYPQMKLIAAVGDVDPFPGTKTMFREEFCEPGHFGGYVFKRSKVHDLHQRMQPVAEWLLKTDCIDLPPKMFNDVPIELDKSTAAHYRDMRDRMEVRIVDQYGKELRTHATNALAQVMRLRQITAGFVPSSIDGWIGGDQAVVMSPLGSEKLDWLREFAEDAGERILVWTQFHFETDRTRKVLTEHGIKCEIVDGRVKDAERAGIVQRFKDGAFQVLLAHPGTMKYGVSFPGVSLSVFLSCSRSCEEYLQAQDRIHGINRGDAVKNSTFYRLLALENGKPTYDHEIQACLDGKEDLHELVYKIDARHRKAAVTA